MHIDGPGPALSCTHTVHTDVQLIECLAKEWGVTVPQLIAMLAALVLSHTERAATQTVPVATLSLLPDMPGRACLWCDRELPPGSHHSRRYCPDTDCHRLAYNAWQRDGRPKRRNPA